jgi:hypothetical protein
MNSGSNGSGCRLRQQDPPDFFVSSPVPGDDTVRRQQEEMMLTVTDTVLEQFDKAIANAADVDADEKCLRIVRSENAGGLSLALQSPAPNDTTYEYEGRTVLAVPATYAEFCEDKTLDIDEEGRLTLA